LHNPADVRAIDIPPNWVCEVISPNTAAHDRVTKRALYARHGVEHYWLVDPQSRTLEALALRDRAWLEVGASSASVRCASSTRQTAASNSFSSISTACSSQIRLHNRHTFASHEADQASFARCPAAA
jgi:hypothetical protein